MHNQMQSVHLLPSSRLMIANDDQFLPKGISVESHFVDAPRSTPYTEAGLLSPHDNYPSGCACRGLNGASGALSVHN